MLAGTTKRVGKLEGQRTKNEALVTTMNLKLTRVMSRLRTTGFSPTDVKTLAYCENPYTDSCNAYSNHIEW